MEFYVVVNYYLVSLNFKFHEDSCINGHARVVKARAHILSQMHAFTTRAHTLPLEKQHATLRSRERCLLNIVPYKI